MKNLRLLLLLALLCAAAYALRRNRAEGLWSVADSSLLPFDSAAALTFAVERRDAPPVNCARPHPGAEWVADTSTRADSRKINFIVESLARARPQNPVSRKTRERRGLDLSHYGLDSPSAVLTITAGKRQTLTVNFGAVSPSGEHVFAKIPSSGDVFAIDRVTVGLLPSSPDDIRSRALLPRPASEIVAARWEHGPPVRIAIEKTNTRGAWRITESNIAAAPLAIAALLDALSAATINKFVWPSADTPDSASPENAAKTFALSPDEARATLTLRYSDGARAELRFGRPAPAAPSSLFVFSTADNAIYTVDSSILEALPANAADIAERRLFPVSESDISSLSINARGRVFTLTRDAESGAWALALPVPFAADQTAAVSFVNGILALENDSLGDAVKISITHTDGAALEAGIDADFITGERLASVIPTTLAAFGRDESDTVVTLRKDGSQEVRLGGDGEWYSTENSHTPDNAAISAITALLRDLRATRAASLWDDDAYGLTPPRARLTVITRANPPLIIQIGAALPDGSAYARIQGSAPIYILSPETVSTLTSNFTKTKN
ncbi:MAG: DUF4340 domain-containing protein [Kiritimatiellaeota bacterium]|nr:DUF4340 domain-containing protein [Kiritimatiellota bacterium]